MATNPYFKQGVKSEQSVYEDIIIEALKFYGQDVYYLPREIINKDKVFLDDVPSRFGNAYKIEMYIENTEAFEGEGDLFTKFGIELRDQANFVVSRKRWKTLVGSRLESLNFRPREGDLIYLTLSQSIFEIRRVETETPFYQLANLPTFRMQCELFEYNDEDMDTGFATIDNIEAEAAYQVELTLDSAAGFSIGETVTQAYDTYNLTGEVTRWSDSDGILRLAHVGASDGKFHQFGTGVQVTGGTSLAKATPTFVDELQAIQADAQNRIFDDFEADFLDFSESNPFGDIS
jgi:hypothetical protein|tara:strand:- start:10686 stop:11555 length:870 start_codon:yes stop_codon:yes gene_type:complete